MYVTTNSALVWKRAANESQQSARLLARVALGFFVLMVALGALAFSAQSRLNDLCRSIQSETLAAQSSSARELGQDITKAYCS